MAEVIVASAIFMGMSLLLAHLLVQNQRASHKISEQSDVTATLMLVFEKVRNELKHSRVVGIDPDNGGLRYWIVERGANGLPVLTSNGLPNWQPGAPADPEVGILYLNAGTGTLWKEFRGAAQPLVPLGPDAELQFVLNPSNNTVVLSGVIGQRNQHDASRDNKMPFAYQICLSNNE